MMQKRMFAEFTEEEKKILELLRKNKFTGIEDLNFNSGISSSGLASTLLNLEMQGVLKVMPGKRFMLID